MRAKGGQTRAQSHQFPADPLRRSQRPPAEMQGRSSPRTIRWLELRARRAPISSNEAGALYELCRRRTRDPREVPDALFWDTASPATTREPSHIAITLVTSVAKITKRGRCRTRASVMRTSRGRSWRCFRGLPSVIDGRGK